MTLEQAPEMLAKRARPGKQARDLLIKEIIARLDRVEAAAIAPPTVRLASVSLPLLAAGTRDYAVTWPTMPGTGAIAITPAIIINGSLVGTATVTVKSFTDSGAVVTVSGAVSVGGTLVVVATRSATVAP